MLWTPRIVARSVTLGALALALLSLQGCASDGTNPDRDPRIDEQNDFHRLPGFTPFSA